jgi:DNA-binding CsgD family transcriptional regulator
VSAPSQTQTIARKALNDDVYSALDELLSEALRSFTSRLDSSSVGVCLYDQGLRCQAANAAFARMSGISAQTHTGKTVHQIFGPSAAELEAMLQSVWSAGTCFLNFPWTARAHPNAPEANWLVNFYPIEDAAGQVRLIATTYFEVTKRGEVELRLGRLTDKYQADLPGGRSAFGDDFTQLSARSLGLVKRSVELLKHSLAMRIYASETRIGAALARLALSLNATHQPEFMPQAIPLLEDLEAEPPSESALGSESKLPPGGPSPRERQLLRLLADGKSNKEIGVVLDISTRTVETYRARVMIKLNLHSTAALVRYAIREKIVEA